MDPFTEAEEYDKLVLNVHLAFIDCLKDNFPPEVLHIGYLELFDKILESLNSKWNDNGFKHAHEIKRLRPRTEALARRRTKSASD